MQLNITSTVQVTNPIDLLKQLLEEEFHAHKLSIVGDKIGKWEKIYHNDIEFEPVPEARAELSKAAYALYVKLNKRP